MFLVLILVTNSLSHLIIIHLVRLSAMIKFIQKFGVFKAFIKDRLLKSFVKIHLLRISILRKQKILQTCNFCKLFIIICKRSEVAKYRQMRLFRFSWDIIGGIYCRAEGGRLKLPPIFKFSFFINQNFCQGSIFFWGDKR